MADVEFGDRPKRVDITFYGALLTVRLEEAAYRGLLEGLRATEGQVNWHELQTDDSVVNLDLSKIISVRLDTEQQRVGF